MEVINKENDLISRRAAINTTWEEPHYTDPLNVLTEVRDRIKALPSAQPDVPNTNVGDTINRQAAIDALTNLDYTPSEWVTKGLSLCKDAIKAIPPAQPEPSTEIQEILDYLDNTLHPMVSPDNWNVYSELYDMISELPSAQPEIVRCKECEYGEQDEVGRWFCRSLGCRIGKEDGSGFCADAERRTDG